MSDFDALIQQSIDDLGWPLFAFARLAVAALCGGLVGLEREVRGRQAGFRTNVLVCVGCCVVMLVSVRMAYMPWPNEQDIQLDPARIAYGVMTGIGFLGAGVIIRHGASVRGLTTAAGIWSVAAIGLAIGIGLYLFAAVATLIVLLVLWVLDYFERLLPRIHYRSVTIRRRWEDHCVSETVRRLRESGFKVADWSFQRLGDLSLVEIQVIVGFRSKHQFDALEDHLPTDADAEVIAVHQG